MENLAVAAHEGLPLSTLNTQAAAKAVIRAVLEAGADNTVLSRFSPDPLTYTIPSRWGPKLYGMPMNLSLELKSSSVRTLVETLEATRKVVRKQGYGEAAQAVMAEAFHSGYTHPLVFTPSAGGIAAEAIFSLEYALALPDTTGRLVVQGPNCFRRLKIHGDLFRPVGLTNRDYPEATKPWLTTALTAPRGEVLYGTFDAVDRVLIWARENLKGERLAGMTRALSWLKMTRNPAIAYRLEQSLYNMKPLSGVETDEFAHLIFTPESLEQIESAWYNTENTPAENFAQLYEEIVPTYMDEGMFRRFFKSKPAKAPTLTERKTERIEEGMVNFKRWFTQIMERVNKC